MFLAGTYVRGSWEKLVSKKRPAPAAATNDQTAEKIRRLSPDDAVKFKKRLEGFIKQIDEKAEEKAEEEIEIKVEA